jgi:hypothetical protein
MPDMRRPESETPPLRPKGRLRLKRAFLWAAIASLGMWAVLLSLIFTGHTKIIWTVEKAAHVTGKVMRKAHREAGKLQGDRDVTEGR